MSTTSLAGEVRVTIGLNHLIREVAADHPNADPNKLARLVADATPAEDLATFYVAALERVVADVIRASRNATLNSKLGRSAKREDIASWWQRLLRERVHVGDYSWKVLGDCTVDDLAFCIQERVDQIGALQGQIAKYEKIVAAMVEHAVDTVAGLPEGSVEL